MEEKNHGGKELFEDVDDWLKEGWGTLTKEPTFEEREAAEVVEHISEITEFEPSYEGGIDLLGQLAERFEEKESKDYNDADRLMIAEMMRKAQDYAREDERKDADAAARALRMRLADINNALMIVDKPHFPQSQKEEYLDKRRNAESALHEYAQAYLEATGIEVSENFEEDAEAETEHGDSELEALALPGDVLT